VKHCSNRLPRAFTLVELMIVVAIIGILAAIAIPNFMKFQARSKQAEAKGNLRAVFTGERSFMAEKDRFSTFIGDISLSPERGNRYSYTLAAGSAVSSCEQRDTAVTTYPSGADSTCITVDTYRYPGVSPFPAAPTAVGVVSWTSTTSTVISPTNIEGGVYGLCPATCSFQASARGNIDLDPAIDYLVTSSEMMQIAEGPCNSATPVGTPGAGYHVYNDVACDN
jgi:type IV pilus assembly protein PilA